MPGGANDVPTLGSSIIECEKHVSCWQLMAMFMIISNHFILFDNMMIPCVVQYFFCSAFRLRKTSFVRRAWGDIPVSLSATQRE